MKWAIQDIDEPESDDLSSPINLDEEEKEDYCFACHGTGESHNPDYPCSWCLGKGFITLKY